MREKRYRVRTGDTIGDALKLCPNLVVVPPHYDLYESRCKKISNMQQLFLVYKGGEKIN